MESVTASVSSCMFRGRTHYDMRFTRGAGDDGLLFKSKLNIDLDLLIV